MKVLQPVMARIQTVVTSSYNKANSRPMMRPWWWVVGGGCLSVMVVAAVVAVTLAVVMVSLRMILCFQIVRFPCSLKRRDRPTYGRTDPFVEMRERI